MVKWLKNEFWTGYTLFEKVFMLSMILLQVIVYCFVTINYWNHLWYRRLYLRCAHG